MVNLIIKYLDLAYTWFWRDFLCRMEPYTFQLRRQATKYPWLWVIVPALIIALYGIYSFEKFNSEKKPLHLVIWILFVTFICWLILHLGGFI